MDYEKKYKDLVKAVKELQEANPSDEGIQNWVNENVPELAECEDEKIRKMLIEFFGKGAERNSSTNGISDKDILAWLEKQKPVDKAEQKFKVGDWVVDEDDNSINQIERVVENVTSGKFSYDLVGGGYFPSTKKNYHLWHLQDAKEGDVLYSPKYNVLWIYMDKKKCHAAINLNYAKFVTFDANIVIPSDICPATKEQRDLFFQKMKEAGCRWNPTEKKLEKIDSGKESESKKEEKSYNTEECNCIIQDTISICEQARKNTTNEIDYENATRCIGWLKILKYRHTYKPSKEQMDTLLFISSVLKDKQVIVNLEELKTLYNDLKKL